MQLKAKRSEVPVTVQAIRTCEEAYDSAFDAYLSAGVQPRPDGDLDKTMFDWPTGDLDWNHLGYYPDGAMRGNYLVNAGETDFTVIGHSDVDNDNTLAQYTATTSVTEELASPNVF